MKITRRTALGLLSTAPIPLATAAAKIDRKALVSRHNPTLRKFDPESPLSVGNGEFAFTADVTGLQTFPELYEKGTPLCTLSQWGWNSFQRPKEADPEHFQMTSFETHGREVGYPVDSKGQEVAYNWLRENPHRFHLGRIGFLLTLKNGEPAAPADIVAIEQTLDLWTGTLRSSFQVEGVLVTVRTAVHPGYDAVLLAVDSELIRQRRLALLIDFPYSSPGMSAADWTKPDAHQSQLMSSAPGPVSIARRLDRLEYALGLETESRGEAAQAGAHSFVFRPGLEKSSLRASFNFRYRPLPRPASPVPTALGPQILPLPTEALRHTEKRWADFWSHGAALDLSAANDPRAQELERRVVLSQYLTTIQCSGALPPQETGLTCNSWNGKFHLEMHWWHAAQFALWDRAPLLEKSLPWYGRVLESARYTAKRQGYAGARWPKMVAYDALDSPSPIGPLLIWQQPHPIWMAELCYQANPRQDFLKQYSDVVFESADFMASFAVLKDGRYVLGPPLIPAQENHPAAETWNPTFELEYWAHGLKIAQDWKRRLKQPPKPLWDTVREKLAPLPVRDGVYLAHENCPQTYTERNRDHPSMLAALGLLPGVKVDRETMRRTLHKVLEVWRWPDTWGWDYPMIAMTAARLGEPETAIKALMMETPKNRWVASGHTPQRANLPCYLPSNGALLLAVAMMATTSSFPAKWNVRHEGLRALL